MKDSMSNVNQSKHDTEDKRYIHRDVQKNVLQKMAVSLTPEEQSRYYFTFNQSEMENFNKQLEEWKGNHGNPLKLIKVGSIPPVMKVLGIRDNPIEMPQSVVSKALRKKPEYPEDKQGHELTLEDIKGIPSSLADPVMVFKSRTRDDSYVFFTEQKDSENRSILIPVAVDKKFGRLVINEITSIYGKDNEVDFVKNNISHNNLVYIDKKRSLDWERECQVQFLAQVLPEQGSLNILTKERLVNFVSANEKTFIDEKQNHKATNHTDEFNESHEINSGTAGKEQIPRRLDFSSAPCAEKEIDR